jgi:signal transduction histidine kinase
VLAGLHSPERPVDYVTFYLFVLGCWGAGALVRGRQRAEAELRVRTAAERVRELVEQTRRTGQPVELETDGSSLPLADAAGLAAYRVVQEALTNALKHAPGHRTVVRVSYAGRGVGIDVTTDGPASAAFVPGRGLSGLRMRVDQCGGSLEAGGLPEGGFRVRARVPAQ